jgi:hypothetical protein
VTADAQVDATDDGPLASATAALVGWLRDACGGEVAVASPGAGDGGLSVWPLELQSELELRTHRTLEPLRLRVRHLVAGDAVLLGKALAAAAAAGQPLVDLTPLPAQTWLALGCPPRVALLVDMPVVIARPMPARPTVTKELRLHLDPISHSRRRET